MLSDLRFALRLLTLNPGFAFAAITTLALGIGANTAMFTVVYEVLLRPLPYERPDRLVKLWQAWEGHLNVIAPANYADWRERSRSFEGTAAFVAGAANLAGTGEAERVPVAHVSASFFEVLRLKPVLGRTFSAADELPAAHIAVIRESFWRAKLAADPGVLGRTLMLDGVPYEIVGVLPDAIEQPSRETVIWRPLYIPPAQLKVRGAHYLSVIARLNDTVTLGQADAELRTIAADLTREHPDTNKHVSATVVSLQSDGARHSRRAVLVLFWATAALLLLACVNVAQLLLARGAARDGELALRAAIGASRARLLRQLLSESLVLAFAGAVGGLLVAMWTLFGVRSMIPDAFADARRAELNLQVFGFAATAALATVVLFGLIPAVRLSRAPLALMTRSLGAQVTRRAAAGRPLIVLQVALAVVLVIGAGLLLNTLFNLRDRTPAFASSTLVTGRVALPSAKYETGAARRIFFRTLLDRLDGILGVDGAAVATRLPLRPQTAQMTFTVDTTPRTSVPGVVVQEMSPRLLELLGISILQGRTLEEADATTPQTVLVSRAFAQRTWGSVDVLGRRLRMGPVYIDEGNPWLTVVGVIEDVPQFSVGTAAAPQVYLPYGQPTAAWAAGEIVIRTTLPAEEAFAVLRGAVRELDGSQPVSALATMASAVDRTLAQPRFMALLTATFAGLAVLLAVIGIYGVVSYAVAKRTREIGVRVALGASRGDVLRLIGLEGLWLVLAGLGLGLLGSALASRGLRGTLFGVSALDMTTYVIASSIMLLAAVLASAVPTLRATRVNPATVLRTQ